MPRKESKIAQFSGGVERGGAHGRKVELGACGGSTMAAAPFACKAIPILATHLMKHMMCEEEEEEEEIGFDTKDLSRCGWPLLP